MDERRAQAMELARIQRLRAEIDDERWFQDRLGTHLGLHKMPSEGQEQRVREARLASRRDSISDDSWVERERNRDIERYEGALALLAEQRARLNAEQPGLGERIASMTHAPAAPRRTVTVDFAGRPVTVGSADYRVAPALSGALEAARIGASLPLYAAPATRPFMAAFDAIEGGASADPLTMAMGVAGAGKIPAALGFGAYATAPDAPGMRDPASASELRRMQGSAAIDYAMALDRGGPWHTAGGFAEGGAVDEEAIDEAEYLGALSRAIERRAMGEDGPEYVQLSDPAALVGEPIYRSFGGDDSADNSPGDGRGGSADPNGTGGETGNPEGPGGSGSDGGGGGGGDQGAAGAGPSVNEGTAGTGQEGTQGPEGAADAPGQTGLGSTAAAADAGTEGTVSASDPESAVANNMSAPGVTSEIGFDMSPIGSALGQMFGVTAAQAAAAPDYLGVKDFTDRAPEIGVTTQPSSPEEAQRSVDPLGVMGVAGRDAALGSGLGLGLGSEASTAAAALGFGATPGPATEAPSVEAATPADAFGVAFGAPMSGPATAATAAALGSTAPPALAVETTQNHPAPPARDPTIGVPPADFATAFAPREMAISVRDVASIPGVREGFAPASALGATPLGIGFGLPGFDMNGYATPVGPMANVADMEDRQQAEMEAREEAQQMAEMAAMLGSETTLGPTDPYGAMAESMRSAAPAQQTQDLAATNEPAPPMGPDEFSVNLPPEAPPAPEVHTVERAPQTVMDMIAQAYRDAFPTRAPEVEAQMRSRQQPGLPDFRDRAIAREDRARAIADRQALDMATIGPIALAAPPAKEFTDRLAAAPAAPAAPASLAQAVQDAVPAAPAPDPDPVPALDPAPEPAAPARAATAATRAAAAPATPAMAPEEPERAPLSFTVQPRDVQPTFLDHPMPPERPTDMVPPGVPTTPYGPAVNVVRGHPTITRAGQTAMRGALGMITGLPIGLIDGIAGRLGLPSIGSSQPAQTTAPYGTPEANGPGFDYAPLVGLPPGTGGPTPGPTTPGEYGEPMDYQARDFLGLPENPETYGERAEHRFYAGGGLVKRAAKALRGPRAEAFDEAQRNAVEMLGLPPDNTAMDRARAMGYTQRGYHSATEPIEEFTPHGKFIGHKGVAGIHIADDPKVASRYLDRFGEFRYDGKRFEKNVMPLLVNTEGFVERGNKPYPKTLKADTGMPVPAGYTNPFRHQGAEGAIFDDMISRRGGVMHGPHPDDPSRVMSYREIVTDEPSRVRSLFAAFDPAKRNSRDLLAGIAPIAATGVAMTLPPEAQPEGYAEGGYVPGALSHARRFAGGGLTGIADIRPSAMFGGLSSQAENLSYAPATARPTDPIPPPSGFSGTAGTSYNPTPPQPPADEQGPLSYGGTGSMAGMGGFGGFGGSVWTPWGLRPTGMWGWGGTGGGTGGPAAPRAYTPPSDPANYGYGPQQRMWG